MKQQSKKAKLLGKSYAGVNINGKVITFSEALELGFDSFIDSMFEQEVRYHGLRLNPVYYSIGA